MIDIHTHILPGVDDGSESVEMSLEMLRLAAEGGTSAVVLTPHNNLPGLLQDTAKLSERFDMLCAMVEEEQLPIELIKGMELFATWNLPDLLEQKKVWTLNNTRYFLVEFDFEEEPYFCDRVLARCIEKGFCPVVAHPERYRFVQKSPEMVYRWICAGYGVQINKGSLLGRFGSSARRTAERLMGCGLVSCVASDAHFPWTRTPHMGEILELLEENYGEEYAEMVLYDNPARILDGRALVGYEPIFPV